MRADTDLEFFPGSNMLVHWVAFNLRPSLERTPKTGSRKLSFPYIFVAGIQLYVFTPSRITIHCQKHDSSPHLHLSCRGGTETYLLPVVPHLHRRFSTPSFFLVIFNYHQSFSLAIQKLSALFMYYGLIQFQFSMNRSIMLQEIKE